MEIIAYCGGTDKLLFGTDYDVYEQKDYLEFVGKFFTKYHIEKDDIDKLMYKNAIKFFNLNMR